MPQPAAMVKECFRLRFFRCACVSVSFWNPSFLYFVGVYFWDCFASWLNYARVRNLCQFKQEALIAETRSQITSIHCNESWLIGIHKLERLQVFIQMPNNYNNAELLSNDEQVWFLFNCCNVLLFSELFCISCWQQQPLSALDHTWTGYNSCERIWWVSSTLPWNNGYDEWVWAWHCCHPACDDRAQSVPSACINKLSLESDSLMSHWYVTVGFVLMKAKVLL